jgi:hypothetical protein
MLGLSGVPWLKLLTHRLSLPKPASAGRVINPEAADQFRATLPQRKPAGCDLLHKRPAGLGVNHPNGPENTSNVRFPGRHHHRLCLDRHRRRRCPDRADLSHPDLMKRQAAARDVRCPWIEYAGARIRFSPRPNFLPLSIVRRATTADIGQAPMCGLVRIHTLHCVNRA